MKRPFCQLIRFKRQRVVDGQKKSTSHAAHPQKVLVVAPYSGHYATLLRNTVMGLLQDHDVYVTDWANARDIPLSQGEFTLDDYIQYLFDFTRHIGHHLNILAVCQPSVPVLALAALMAQDDDPYQPQSMILMGGPIDTRISPTKVNLMAKERSYEWFERKIIANVPAYYAGALRRVCPGFIILAGFMHLNLNRHIEANHNLFLHLTQGDDVDATNHRLFYNEYRSVLDMPADYYLDSIRVAFQEHALALGNMTWKNQRVNPSLIRKTALMTVEGERDDISGNGQTFAAHGLCDHLPDTLKYHYLQADVGHYGVFNGGRWRKSILPKINSFITHVADYNKNL